MTCVAAVLGHGLYRCGSQQAHVGIPKMSAGGHEVWCRCDTVPIVVRTYADPFGAVALLDYRGTDTGMPNTTPVLCAFHCPKALARKVDEHATSPLHIHGILLHAPVDPTTRRLRWNLYDIVHAGPKGWSLLQGKEPGAVIPSSVPLYMRSLVFWPEQLLDDEGCEGVVLHSELLQHFTQAFSAKYVASVLGT